jgi:DNA topoisomerase VI subunit A
VVHWSLDEGCNLAASTVNDNLFLQSSPVGYHLPPKKIRKMSHTDKKIKCKGDQQKQNKEAHVGAEKRIDRHLTMHQLLINDLENKDMNTYRDSYVSTSRLAI